MRRWWFVGVALLAACVASPSPSAAASGASPEWVEELRALDPTLGGAELLRRRLAEDPTLIWTELDAESEAERDRVLLAAIADEQPAMRSFVAQRIDASTAREVIAFLRSDAGHALAAAELMALTLYAVMHPDEFSAGSTSLGDPDRVGEMARRQFLDVQQRFAEGTFSPSPPQLAWLVQAMTITRAQARQIEVFHASEAGRRWAVLQQAAVAEVRPVRHRLVDVARAHGWVSSAYDDLDLTLPRAEFDDPPGGDRDGGR